MGRDVYSVSAECKEASTLMVMDGQQIFKVIEEDPANGLQFMKQLAGMLGNRLLQIYQMFSSIRSADTVCSFGTNRITEFMNNSR